MNLKLPINACDPERPESFLSGELSEVQEREFTLHLNSCESCRCSLAEQAAEPQAWREAEMLLKPPQFTLQIADEQTEQSTRQPLQIQYVLDGLGPTDDPAMLGRLGGYEVTGVVGAGGMGVVLKAIDKSLDRTVAIKVLAPHLATSGAARKRFAREAKAAAAVLHPNVIAIYSVSNHESLPYLVMPYVGGISLQKRLDREGPLTLHEILRIGSQVAAGLAAAHAQGLVHRDIKPANILLEEGIERVTLTDFGLARAVDDATITHSGMIAGTPQYMSPEQARGEAPDPRSDLFSLGSVLYAVCTGRPPFRAETSYGVMRRITDDEPTSIRELNADVPQWLCRIINRLMSKRAADRYASAAEVAELLEACLAHVQQPTVAQLPASLRLPAERCGFSVSHRSLGVIVMIAALGVGLLGLFAWQETEAPDIAGYWSGEGWGEVVLIKTEDGEYAGTYTRTVGQNPGEIQLKWSRLERRYNGEWREEGCFGELTARLVGEEIRGASLTDAESKIDPSTPRLADLSWKRGTRAAGEPTDKREGSAAAAPAADEPGAPPKGLEFLAQYKQLRGLSLRMTEKEFLAIVDSEKLVDSQLEVHKSVVGGETTYSIPMGDGHTVLVMFGKDADKCTGIQRIRGEAKAAEPGKRTDRNPGKQETGSKRQRFEPVRGQADRTNWTVIPPPSFFSKSNWAVMARMTIGGEARIQLPKDTQPRCTIKLLKGDDEALTVQVEDAAKKSKTVVRIARDSSAEVTVDDVGYNINYPSVRVALDQPDASPFAQVIVRRVENDGETGVEEEASGRLTPKASALSVLKQLLGGRVRRPGSETAAAAAPPSIDGTWEVRRFDKATGQEFAGLKLVLESDGETLRGTALWPDGKETPIAAGSIADGRVSFKVTPGSMIQDYGGEIDGGVIRGKWAVGIVTLDWEARRASEVTAEQLHGRWKFEHGALGEFATLEIQRNGRFRMEHRDVALGTTTTSGRWSLDGQTILFHEERYEVNGRDTPQPHSATRKLHVRDTADGLRLGTPESEFRRESTNREEGSTSQ